MADKYHRVQKKEDLPFNEIRVRKPQQQRGRFQSGGVGKYLKRAVEVLGKENQVIIKGISEAIETAVKLAELVKHKIKNIYQENKIE